MAYPLAQPAAFAANSTNPLSNLDQDLVNITNAVNGIGNGASALTNINVTGGTFSGNVIITGGTAILASANVSTLYGGNVIISGGTAILASANLSTINLPGGTAWTPNDASGANVTITVDPITKYYQLGPLFICNYNLTFGSTSNVANVILNGLPASLPAGSNTGIGVPSFQNTVGASAYGFVGVATTKTFIAYTLNTQARVTNSQLSSTNLSGTIIFTTS